MTPAMTLCLLSAGGFLLTGMLLGVWKYHGVMTRPEPPSAHLRRSWLIEQRCGIALPPLC